MIVAGSLSDRVGRRTVYVGAFMVIAAAMVLFPLAREPVTLVIVRVVIAVGIGSGLMMLGSTIADYPQNASRGKLISINGVLTGIGVVAISSLWFAQLPEMVRRPRRHRDRGGHMDVLDRRRLLHVHGAGRARRTRG